MALINVFFSPASHRSKMIAKVMQQGIIRSGDKARLVNSNTFDGKVTADAAVFYGLSDKLDQVFKVYREQSTAVYIDLGYWQRRINNKYDGYHKVSVNNRHPTAYFQNRQHDAERFKRLDIEIQPWKEGGSSVLLAGMSSKACWAEGLANEQWERNAAKMIRVGTPMPIYYRPKPTWTGARIINGTHFQRNIDLAQAFSDCHAVVTHHSNVAVDAILAGVPVFCVEGVATPMACTDLRKIATPLRPDGREQWAADIAWTQFTPNEMANGLPWRVLRAEGVIPC